MSANLLLPAAVLIFWTMLVLLYMVYLRLPALQKLGDKFKDAPAGGRYQDVEEFIPAKVNWPSHNYTHLLEQPTVFYPAIIILHISGANDAINLGLAWGYVGLRIFHSIWQTFFNKIPVRMALFAISSTLLVILAGRTIFALI